MTLRQTEYFEDPLKVGYQSLQKYLIQGGLSSTAWGTQGPKSQKGAA